MRNQETIERISKQIAEKDKQLSRLFDEFIERIIQESEYKKISSNHEQKNSTVGILVPGDILINSDVEQNINIIPSTNINGCKPNCVCFAFGKWNSSKGFKGVTARTIAYWLSCSKINNGTLIFTYAWDEIDFIENYKNHFDKYTSDNQHTVAVILCTAGSISVQYLNR